MEYERALFRVYDKSLESLRHNNPILNRDSTRPKTLCTLLQAFILGLAFVLICSLVVLHVSYVDKPGCLERSILISAEDAGVLINEIYEPKNSSSSSINTEAGVDEDKFVVLSTGQWIPADVVISVKIGDQSPEEYSEQVKSGAINASDFQADYTFAFEPAILWLDDSYRMSHNFTSLNTTIERTECFGNGLDGSLLILTGYDVPIINQFMFTFHKGGMLYSNDGDEWWWSDTSIPPNGGYGFWYSYFLKFLALTRAVLTFALLSATTALIVRMLLSSGVIVMFPLFYVLRAIGISDLDDHVLLASYPWVGQPIQEFRNRRKPVGPFILAHFVQVIVYYSLYNAAQVVWTLWLYNKSISTSLEVSLFAMVLLWEYFSLVFVRSSASISFFPRATIIYFTAFHLYFFYYSRGFFNLAAGAMSLMMLHGMLYIVTDLEVPAIIRGEISIENPRAWYVQLPWPSWSASMPPTWTLFLPPNARVRGIYEEGIPLRPERTGSESREGLHQRHQRRSDDIESN